MDITFKIYADASHLPINWDNFSVDNIFLSKKYLEILEKSAPSNMICHFIGFFQNEELVGVAISQFLDATKLESFGERDRCIKTAVRNFFFKNFSSKVLIIGNNLLTGQNAFSFLDKIDSKTISKVLKNVVNALELEFKNKGLKIHLTTLKDFDSNEISVLQNTDFESFYKFSVQPNMVFEVRENWKTEQDYIDNLSKKYRDQYKRSHKKMEGIVKQKMDLEAILKHEKVINDLYFYVAKNAPFNTFFLANNHFSVFKDQLKNDFLFYGYFIDNQLIGFNTLIKNANTLDTYFLGYDDAIQKDKMLYLNMLYDMIGYAIKKKFKKIIFARTALEIKSSVGAKPVKMYGLIKHSNWFLNKNMHRIFTYLEPEAQWQERNPFKE